METYRYCYCHFVVRLDVPRQCRKATIWSPRKSDGRGFSLFALFSFASSSFPFSHQHHCFGVLRGVGIFSRVVFLISFPPLLTVTALYEHVVGDFDLVAKMKDGRRTPCEQMPCRKLCREAR